MSIQTICYKKNPIMNNRVKTSNYNPTTNQTKNQAIVRLIMTKMLIHKIRVNLILKAIVRLIKVG